MQHEFERQEPAKRFVYTPTAPGRINFMIARRFLAYQARRVYAGWLRRFPLVGACK